jgi:hypothetical protein
MFGHFVLFKCFDPLLRHLGTGRVSLLGCPADAQMYVFHTPVLPHVLGYLNRATCKIQL